mmetsp:Transcript_25245/g.45670  ORF Transcript_25245/g.45670 Transcript_25245/m.45670 type:complete len:111 (+) Transcript_25245:752-1084(+)
MEEGARALEVAKKKRQEECVSRQLQGCRQSEHAVRAWRVNAAISPNAYVLLDRGCGPVEDIGQLPSGRGVSIVMIMWIMPNFRRSNIISPAPLKILIDEIFLDDEYKRVG